MSESEILFTDWQYNASINHTAMCENTEAIKNRQNLGIYYFLEQAARMDVFIFEVSQAEEVSTSTGKQRRFSIISAHGYAALSYALLPYTFAQDYTEAGYNQNVMTKSARVCTAEDRLNLNPEAISVMRLFR